MAISQAHCTFSKAWFHKTSPLLANVVSLQNNTVTDAVQLAGLPGPVLANATEAEVSRDDFSTHCIKD